MDTSAQFLTQEKRESKSKDCTIQFEMLTDGFAYYNSLDEENKIKYIGRIEPSPSLDEYCSCPDQFHRNSQSLPERARVCIAMQAHDPG